LASISIASTGAASIVSTPTNWGTATASLQRDLLPVGPDLYLNQTQPLVVYLPSLLSLYLALLDHLWVIIYYLAWLGVLAA